MNHESKPQGLSDQELEEALLFLDDLREMGTTNMYGARPYLQAWWGDEYSTELDDKKAKEILIYWMRTFSDRHKAVSP